MDKLLSNMASKSGENYHRRLQQASAPVRIPIQPESGYFGTEAGTPPIGSKNARKSCFCCKPYMPWLVVIVMLLIICGLCGYADYRKLLMSYMGKPEVVFYATMDIPYDPYDNESLIWQESNEIHEENYQAYHYYWRNNKEDDFSFKHPGTDRVFRQVIKVKVNENVSVAHVLVICIKDDRAGGFVHDFILNQTAIIDPITDRCFVMPLDRTITLSPQHFVEMGTRMSAGDFDINLKRTIRRLKVNSFNKPCQKLLSPHVIHSCFGSEYYMVDDLDEDVDQDDVHSIPEAGKFAEFFGNGYVEFDIVNIPDVDAWEKQHALF